VFLLADLFSARNVRKTAGRTTIGTPWLSFTRRTGTITEHPITKLMNDAKVAFTTLLVKQRKTLLEAVAEYKRRYSREPPSGFDH
jgi:hypothetical protein